jgi:Fic family protein
MPFIPEETIDFVREGVDDIRDTLRIQIRTVEMVADQVKVANEIAAKTYEAVTKPTDGESLSDLITHMIDCLNRQTEAIDRLTKLIESRR